MASSDIPSAPTTMNSTKLSASNSITTLAQSSMFWRPAYLAESGWLEHIPFLFWMVQAHKPSTFVELGTQSGASYFATCQAIDRLQLDASCFAVSTWSDEGISTDESDAMYAKVKSYNETHYSSFSSLVRSPAKQALNHFADNSIDLICFNRLKGTEADTQLINAWIPKLSEKGLVLIHNTNVRQLNMRVHGLFRSLKEYGPAFEFRHGGGLGVLGIGENQPELINVLFEDAQSLSRNRVVQDVFSRLGRACADSYSARAQGEQTNKLLNETKTLQSELQSVAQKLLTTQQMLNENNKESSDLQQRVDQQIETHALERGQLVERISQVQGLYDKLKEDSENLQRSLGQHIDALGQKDQEIRAYKEKCEFQSNEINELKQTLKQNENEIETLQHQIRSKDTAIAERFREIAVLTQQNENEIETLQHEIRSKDSAIADRFSEIAELTRLLELLEKNPGAKVKSLLAKTVKPTGQTGAQFIGVGTGHVPSIRTRVTARKYVKLIEKSGLFDAEWYKARYPDLNASKKARNNPALHYYLFGGFEARDPSDKFNSGWYLQQNPDVIEAGINPLVHYLLHGKAEGRLPKPTAF
jgi:Methyltransferase domain